MLTMAFTGLGRSRKQVVFQQCHHSFHGPAPLGTDGSAAALTFGPDDKGSAAAALSEARSCAVWGKVGPLFGHVTGLDSCARKPLM